MKQSINSHDFHRAFEQQRPDNFSYRGLSLLFDYLERLEEDTGEEIELDVVAICCDWSEEPLVDVLENYSLESLEELQENTTVLLVDEDTVIYLAY